MKLQCKALDCQLAMWFTTRGGYDQMTTITILAVIVLLAVLGLSITLAGVGRLLAPRPQPVPVVFDGASDARTWRAQRPEGLGQ